MPRASTLRALLLSLSCTWLAACSDSEPADGGDEATSSSSSPGATTGTGGQAAAGGNDTGAGPSSGGTGGTGALVQDPIVLDDFSDLRTNVVLPDPERPPQPLWFPYDESSNPTASGGILSIDVDGTPQIYCRPSDNLGWYFIRAIVESGTWSDNGFNRLRFSVKQPEGLTASTDGSHNIEIGTFLHVGSTSDGPWANSDDNNWHFYHFLDLPSDGLYYHVIIDTYPDHQRSEPGGDEQGDQEFPEGGDTFNYFSMMSSFYYDIPYAPVTGTVQFRQFSLFYEDNATVPLDQVRSLNGAFDPTTNTVKLGWHRRKDQSGLEYEVRWSYEPIVDFDAANSAGTVTAPDTDAYNSVHFTFTEPDLASHELVYVAVRPQESTLFRQFWLEL